MKKLLFIIVVLAMALPSMVLADACFILDRNGDPTLPTNVANAIERACNRDGNCNEGTCGEPMCWWEYDGRVRPLDVISVQPIEKCPEPAVHDPDSIFFNLVVTGIDWTSAKKLENPWWTPYNDEFRVKSQKRYGYRNLPGPIQSVVDNNSWYSISCDDICGYIGDRLTDLVGADCLAICN